MLPVIGRRVWCVSVREEERESAREGERASERELEREGEKIKVAYTHIQTAKKNIKHSL